MLTLSFAMSFAFAGPQRTTYQAKIIKPDGNPLEAANVNFKFTILDPAGSCILYSETFSGINMSSTGGLTSFSLGSGVKSYPVSAVTFADVFSNITPTLSCDIGGPANYSPLANDIRKIIMQFNDGNGWQTLPAMNINAVPYAIYANNAEKLGDLAASAFVQDTEIPTCSGDERLFYNGTAFTCTAASGAGVTSSTVVSALGYTPANSSTVTILTTNLSTVSSTVLSLSTSYTSLANSVVASFAAMASSSLTQLNGSTSSTQSFAIGNTGNLPAFSTANGVHTLNIPNAASGSVTGGLLSNIDYTTFMNKVTSSAASIAQILGFTPASQVSMTSVISDIASVSSTKITSSSASIAQVLGYVPAASGSTIGSQWATSGTQISYMAGNVGVGSAGLTNGGSIPARYWRIKSAMPGSSGSYIAISELRFVWGGVSQSLAGYTITNLGAAFDGSYPISKMKDGVAETSNANSIAATLSNMDIYVDLTTQQTVTAIEIAPQGDQNSISYNNPTNLTIEASDDASSWTPIMVISNISSGYPNWNPGSYRSFTVNLSLPLLSRLTVTGSTNDSTGSALNVTNSDQSTLFFVRNDGNIGLGNQSPSAVLHLKAGLSAANKAPLKFSSGTLTSAAEAGAIEYDGFNLYYTDGTNTRRALATNSGTGSFDNVTSINNTGNISLVPTGSVVVSSTTVSTNSQTGALVVKGGLGVAGDIYSNNIEGVSITATNGVSTTVITGAPHLLLNPNGGNVGIGTITPELKLSLDNDGGLMAKGTYGSGVSVTTTGAGTRMFWYPKRSAFRVGSIDNTQWNDTNIGDYSMGLGYNALASKIGSISMGFKSQAYGDYSLALGTQVNAGGAYSIAIGASSGVAQTAATGSYSIAMGNNSQATGNNAVALGTNNNSYGANSFALGWGNTLNGMYGFGVGFSNTTDGWYGMGLGYYLTAESAKQITLGAYNLPRGGENVSIWMPNDPLLVVGNGTGAGANRSNALMILKNGNIGVGTNYPTAKLQLVSGTSTMASLKLTSGTLLTSPQSGTIEYDGFYYYVTDGSNTRRMIATGSSVGSGTAAAPSLSFTNDSNTGLYNPYSDYMSIVTGGSDRIVINSAGNVGIGMNAGASFINDPVLQVYRNTGDSVLTVATGAGVSNAVMNLYNSSSGTNGYSIYSEGSTSDLVFQAASAGVNTVRMRLGNAGLLSNTTINTGDAGTPFATSGIGINTTGFNWLASGTGYVAQFTNANTTASANGLHIYTEAANASNYVINARSNNLSRFVVRGDGSIGAGTATPAYNLHVVSSTDTTIGVQATGTNNFAQFTALASGITTVMFSQPSNNAGGIGTNSNHPLYFRTNGTERMRIDTDGNVGIGTTAPTEKLVVSGSSYMSGHMAIGRDSGVDGSNTVWGPDNTYNSLLMLQETVTQVARPYNEGITLTVEANPSAATPMYYGVYGIEINAGITTGNTRNASDVAGIWSSGYHGGTGTVNRVVGASLYAGNYSNGTVNSAMGVQVSVQNAGGNISNSYGYLVNTPYTSGGTIANNYGLYIADQTAANITNTYNLYSAGSGKNYFSGNVGIGTSSPNSKLTVSGTVETNTGVKFPDGRTQAKAAPTTCAARYGGSTAFATYPCNGNTCTTEYGDMINCFSGITRTGTGEYTITMTGFTETPFCVASAASGGMAMQTNVVSATSVNIITNVNASGGGAVDTPFTVICTGF